MDDPLIAKIQAHPGYAELKRRRNGLGLLLITLMLLVYYATSPLSRSTSRSSHAPSAPASRRLASPSAWH